MTGTDTTGTSAVGQLLTTEDRELLARPLHGFLTTAAAPPPARPRPIWFEAAEDGTIHFFTLRDAPKLRSLQRDPRASLVVAAPAGERERWVSVTGSTTVLDDDAHDLAARLATRYWGPDGSTDGGTDERADDRAGILADDKVHVVLTPESVQRFAF